MSPFRYYYYYIFIIINAKLNYSFQETYYRNLQTYKNYTMATIIITLNLEVKVVLQHVLSPPSSSLLPLTPLIKMGSVEVSACQREVFPRHTVTSVLALSIGTIGFIKSTVQTCFICKVP